MKNKKKTPPICDSPLRGLVQRLLGDRVFGLQSPEVAEVAPPWESCFGQRSWAIEVDCDNRPLVPQEMLEAISSDSGHLPVLVDTFCQQKYGGKPRVVLKEQGIWLHDSAAVIFQTMAALPNGTVVGFWAPISLLTSESSRKMREILDDSHGVKWIIYLSGKFIPNVSPSFTLIFLVVEVGGKTPLKRLVDLRGCEPDYWETAIERAKKRTGGNVGNISIVRKENLESDPWTYERWTTELQRVKNDTAELGKLHPLKDFVQSFEIGLNLVMSKDVLVERPESGKLESGVVPLIGGREVQSGSIFTASQYGVEENAVDTKILVEEGDILIRRICANSPAGPKVVAARAPAGLKAAFSGSVIRLRWKPELPSQAKHLFLSWLASEKASMLLAVDGVGMQLTLRSLENLLVPMPSKTTLDALEEVQRLEDWHLKKAKEIRATREDIFSAEDFSKAVPALLETQRVESEMVSAATNSQTFHFKIRNTFPHPLALRFERLQAKEHGEARIRETAECAEYVVHYLAICGLLQLQSLRPELNLPSKQLDGRMRGNGGLAFSFGLSWDVFTEAVNATMKSGDLLTTSIPHLAELADTVRNTNRWSEKGLAKLQKYRNDQAHLHRQPPKELPKISRELGAGLVHLMEAVNFISDYPLAYVHDYELDSLSGERTVQLDLMCGSGVVFQRMALPVDKEVARGSAGILRNSKTFLPLSPWLVIRECASCGSQEAFLFNRAHSGVATYVAMESGHTWEVDVQDVGLQEIFHAK